MVYTLKKQTINYDKLYLNGESVNIVVRGVCSSNIIESEKKFYFKCKIEDNVLLNTADLFCSQVSEGYSSLKQNDEIFVKLPYRYKRFMIKFHGFSCSDDIIIGNQVEMLIEICGIVKTSLITTCSIKCLEFKRL